MNSGIKLNSKLTKNSLSVVIIAKNEENFIKHCLESVLFELSELSDWEIVLVDSSSTDKTVEIAKEFPCKIFVISGKSLSASLGRYIGTMNTTKDYILFLDGDMELCKGWLQLAFKYLKEDKKASGIIGVRDDFIYKKNGENVEKVPNYYNIQEYSVANHFGGAFLAERKILKEVGGYDPRMFSAEEPELHSRIMRAGYHVLQIPVQMIVHHNVIENEGLFNKIRSFTGKRSLGLAIGFKLSVQKRNLKNYFWRMREFLIPIFMDFLNGLLILLILFNNFKNINTLIVTTLGIQLISFLFTVTIGKPKRFLQSKFLLISFITGLFCKVDLEYEVTNVK